MSIFVAENFIRKRGVSSLFHFQKMLNSGKKLSEIGATFQLSEVRVSVLRDKLFIKSYELHPHVKSYLNCQVKILQSEMKVVKFNE